MAMINSQTAQDGTHYQWHGDQGPVVVLVHGLGLNRQMWQWQVPALEPTYRVLTYDLMGHGQSPDPTVTPDLTLFASQLYNLTHELDVERFAVVGFSLGGMIVRRFAMDYPGLLSALVIMSSAHKRSDDEQQAILKRLEQVTMLGPESTVELALERWFSEDFRVKNPAIMSLVRTWVLANDRHVYPKNYAVLAKGVDELITPSPAIDCPTLVMTGDQDFGNSPRMTQAIAAEIVGSQTVLLPGLRHMALAEDPNQCNSVILSFLRNRLGE